MVDSARQLSATAVLVAFQKRAVAHWVVHCLRQAGYIVAVAKGYRDARRRLSIIEPDAAILCAGMLDGDTEAFFGWLERDPHACSIPTVVVAPSKSQPALANIAARRRTRGAYLCWPLKCRDLQLTMRDLLESDERGMDQITNGHLVLDRRSRVLRGRAGITILSATECRLAEYLMSQGRRTIPVEGLLTRVFDFRTGDGNPDLVRAHVAALREKIKIVTGGTDLIRVLNTHGIVFHRSRDTARRQPQFP